jgi:hypothetical protein
MKSLLTVEDGGRHNADLAAAIQRINSSKAYKDVSTICIIPTKDGMIPSRVCTAIWNLQSPMNQKFLRLTLDGKEVGEAYNEAVRSILAHPELGKWKYLLTMEWDNVPPVDGLLKLYESIEKYDAVGGLYWTKGEGGMPMIYGNPKEFPKNFLPQLPIPNEVQECNGLGMGFTLFRLNMFRKVPEPWFKTMQEVVDGGMKVMTQDLYFFEKAGKEGHRFACDNRVTVGHLDVATGELW